MYALISLGLVVLLVGVGSAIIFFSTRSKKATSVSSSSTDAGTTDAGVSPGVIPSPPLTAPSSPSPTSSADASVAPDARSLDSIVDAGLLRHPWLTQTPRPSKQDATALVPITEDTPLLGAQHAKVTLVLFAGLHGKANRDQLSVIATMLDKYPTSLRLAIRLLPMSDHRSDETKALSALQAFSKKHEPDAVWSFLTGDESATPATPSAKARKLLDADRQLAGQLMVRITPTLFVNGRRFNGFMPSSKLRFWIDEELKAAKAELVAGTKQDILYSSRSLFWITDGDADRKR
jgi:protein-disulfide isomerase